MFSNCLQADSLLWVSFYHLLEQILEVLVQIKAAFKNLPKWSLILSTQSPVIGVLELGRSEGRAFCQHQKQSHCRWKHISLSPIILLLALIKELRRIVLLRSHVGLLLHDELTVLIQIELICGKTKVPNEKFPLYVNQEILWFHIPMHNSHQVQVLKA